MKGPEVAASLAAGIALGAVLGGGHAVLSCCCIAAAAALFMAMRHQGTNVWVFAAVVLAGACRGISWRLGGGELQIQELPCFIRIHDALVRAICRTGFDPQATALVKALLCGDRSDIDPQVRAAFRSSGASHILALSGLHLGIIYGMVSKILGIFGGSPIAVKARGCAIIMLCGIYAAATGASPSIVRAFLFITLRECARMSGRNAESMTIFSSGLMIHLLLTPGSVTSAGFQLSYLAMCGIYLLYPHLKAIYPQRREDPITKVWNLAALSLSCQIFTAPVAWIRFHSFPKWFLLTNLTAMPLSTALIICAVTAVTLNCIGLPIHPLVMTVDILAKLLSGALSIISEM